jgi:hypothetical protein
MSGHDENDLNKLEQSLAELRPSPAGFDRDRLMFQAGQAARPRRLLWPAATGLMTAVAACLGLFLLLRPAAEPQVRVVYIERAANPAKSQAPPPETPALPPAQPEESTNPGSIAYSYWRLQALAARHGADELPDAAVPAVVGPAASATTTAGGWRSQPASASSLFNSGVE